MIKSSMSCKTTALLSGCAVTRVLYLTSAYQLVSRHSLRVPCFCLITSTKKQNKREVVKSVSYGTMSA